MRHLAPIVLLTPLFAAPLAADDVHLKNGRVFEDVVAEQHRSSVRIELAFGEMTLPLDAVERIERSESSLVAYRERRDALAGNAAGEASDWVDLARWALARGLDHGAREAALHAAALDPSAEGLADLMRRFEHIFEPSRGAWISHEESLLLRGYQRVDGQWLSVEQQLARAEAVASAARAREADEERRLTRAVLALAAAQMTRQPEPEPRVVYPWPVGFHPNPFVWPHPHPHKPPPRPDPTALPIERRQPGSLFPVATHRGSIESAPSGDRRH